MIKSYQDHKRITPKKKAAEIVEDFMDQMLDGWEFASLSLTKSMTDSERREVQAQLEKYSDRVQKILGRN